MIKRRENVYFLRARAFRTTHTNLGLLFVLLYELWNVVQNIEKLGSVTRTLIFLIVQLRHKHIGFFAFFFPARNIDCCSKHEGSSDSTNLSEHPSPASLTIYSVEVPQMRCLP